MEAVRSRQRVKSDMCRRSVSPHHACVSHSVQKMPKDSAGILQGSSTFTSRTNTNRYVHEISSVIIGWKQFARVASALLGGLRRLHDELCLLATKTVSTGGDNRVREDAQPHAQEEFAVRRLHVIASLHRTREQDCPLVCLLRFEDLQG